MTTLAKRISIREGKKKQVDIAQIKEVMRCLAIELASDEEALASFILYVGKYVKWQKTSRKS